MLRMMGRRQRPTSVRCNAFWKPDSTFGAMARRKNGAEAFLDTVQEREAALIAMLFDAPAVACETQLRQT